MSYLHEKNQHLLERTSSCCSRVQCRIIASFESVVFSSASLTDISKIFLFWIFLLEYIYMQFTCSWSWSITGGHFPMGKRTPGAPVCVSQAQQQCEWQAFAVSKDEPWVLISHRESAPPINALKVYVLKVNVTFATHIRVYSVNE